MARYLALLAGLALLAAGCSVKTTVVGMIGDSLSGGGGVFESDEDPELVREALPFGLKTYESLLAVTPEHEGLLLASAKGFTAYAYLLTQEADLIDEDNLEQARKNRARAKKLFLRGRDFAVRGLELNHPNFMERLRKDWAGTLAETEKEDVAFLYWAGASWAGALSADKGDLALIAELPLAAALVARVLELDETFGQGAAHEFYISYEGARPGGSPDKAREHYHRALELSEGQRISVHLSLAEAVTIKAQNLAEFRRLIGEVKEFDLEQAPKNRMVNTLSKNRARWLESRTADLFLDAEPEGGTR